MPSVPSKALASRPDGWALIKRNRPAMLSLGFLVFISVAAVLVPWFLPAELKETSSGSFLPPLAAGLHGKVTHLCGTDVNGQDLFYRLLTGAQVSLGIGVLGAVLSLFVG